MTHRFSVFAAFAFVVSCVLATSGQATVIWQESINGDLSNTQGSPSTLVLGNGTNSIIGSVQSPGDTREWVTVTVLSGFQLSSYVNSAYSSADVQGFTGFQTGSVFVGANFLSDPSLYNGYSHFGTSAQNGAFPAFNSIGLDLFPKMIAQGAGSTGFTTPLGSGSYAFIIQQTGSSLTNYQFDFNVTPVPEPSTLLLSSLGGLAFGRRLWKRRSMAA